MTLPIWRQHLNFTIGADTLVVWRLHRLGRNLADLVGLVAELEQRKINFESMTEKIETSSPAGRLVFHVFATLAEFERNLIREELSRGSKQPAPAVESGPSVNERRDPCDSILLIFGNERHRISKLSPHGEIDHDLLVAVRSSFSPESQQEGRHIREQLRPFALEATRATDR